MDSSPWFSKSGSFLNQRKRKATKIIRKISGSADQDFYQSACGLTAVDMNSRIG
jgi:hypothetical protein